MRIRTFTTLAIVVGSLALGGGVQAQPPGSPGESDGVKEDRPAGPGGGPREFMRRVPVIAALDADGDGEISSDEVQNAAAALQELDKNSDGKLTLDELRPSAPGRRGPAAGDRPNRNRRDADRRGDGGRRRDGAEGRERGDHRRGDHRDGDHERGDRKRDDHRREDARRGDHGRGDHGGGDHKRGDRKRDDHRRDDARRGDHERGDHERGDHERGNHERGDHERGDRRPDDHRREDARRGGPREGGAERGIRDIDPEKMVERIMSNDKDGDGLIGESELPERMQGLLNRADADEDGSLSLDEVTRFAERIKARGGRKRGGPAKPGRPEPSQAPQRPASDS